MKRDIWYYRVPVLAFCAAMFIQSHFPCVNLPCDGLFTDKILHAAAYAVLGFLSHQWLTAERPGGEKEWILIAAIVVTSVFGISDEFHQSFISGRTASVYDALADCAGAVLGVWGGWQRESKKKSYSRRV